MTARVALLRAVNVGGRKLLMTDLKRIAEEAGLGRPKTYIASGNLLFVSDLPEAAVQAELEKRLNALLGKPVEVLVRTAAEMRMVCEGNPFADQPGNRVAAIFLGGKPAACAIESARHVDDERLALGEREIYVHYPSGMGGSRMQLPAVRGGTARNMNTVAKLADLAEEMA